MSVPSRSPAAGGFPIAIGALAGAVIGFTLGEATIGFLIGAAAGVVIALGIWLFERR